MSTLQIQVSQSLEGLSEENLKFLLYMINRFMKPEEASANKQKNKICRPLGMYKDEQFCADGYDIDEDNEEIARMFGVVE